MSDAIEQLKKKHHGKWLAIHVLKSGPMGEPLEGELLQEYNDHDTLWKSLPQKKGMNIYVTFAGTPLEEGYAAAFYYG